MSRESDFYGGAMAYPIKCPKCPEESYPANIVELIDKHTNKKGELVCEFCGRAGAYVYQESALQEKGKEWKRYYKGIVPLPSRDRWYSPYAWLVADAPRARARAIQLCYYKDLRPDGGKLKHGHGPGGTPVLGKRELLHLLRRLAAYGVLTKSDVKSIFPR